MKPEDKLRAQVAVLGEKFLQRTRDQLTSLRALTGQIQQGDAGALRRIHEIAHQIHGSGAIFGYVAISEAAGQIEGACSGHLTANVESDPQARILTQRLTEGLEQLAKVLATAH